jgi:hypothetical protein
LLFAQSLWDMYLRLYIEISFRSENP